MTGKRRASILVALAHPDDEIFHGGMLAHLAERGLARDPKFGAEERHLLALEQERGK
jgi:hypothetical protein